MKAAEVKDPLETEARQDALLSFVGEMVMDEESDADQSERDSIQVRRYAYFQAPGTWADKVSQRYGWITEARGENKEGWDRAHALRDKYRKDYKILEEVLLPLLQGESREHVIEWIRNNGSPEKRDARLAQEQARGEQRLAERRTRLRFIDDNFSSLLLLVPLLLCIVLVVLGLLREIRPDGMLPGNESVYRVGTSRFTIREWTGIAAGCQTPVHTTTSRSTDSQGRSSSYSETHIHKLFHIVRGDRVEHPVHLVDSGVSVRDGNTISALWTTRSGSTAPIYLMFYNHNLANGATWMHGLTWMTRARSWPLLPAFIGAGIGTYMCQAAGFIGDRGWRSWMPLIIAIVAMFLYSSIAKGFARRRAQRIVNEQGPKWIKGFRETADKEGPIGGDDGPLIFGTP